MTFDLPNAVAVLARTPHTLRAMLSGLSPAWIDATEGGDSWSPYTIVGHLLHGERTDWIPRARIILAQGNERRFAPYDRLAQFHESQGQVARRAAHRVRQPSIGQPRDAARVGVDRSGVEPRGRAPCLRRRDAAATAGHVDGARPRPRGAGGTGDGQTVPRRRRAVARVSPDHGAMKDDPFAEALPRPSGRGIDACEWMSRLRPNLRHQGRGSRAVRPPPRGGACACPSLSSPFCSLP
jgi:hypothetical protein